MANYIVRMITYDSRSMLGFDTVGSLLLGLSEALLCLLQSVSQKHNITQQSHNTLQSATIYIWVIVKTHNAVLIPSSSQPSTIFIQRSGHHGQNIHISSIMPLKSSRRPSAMAGRHTGPLHLPFSHGGPTHWSFYTGLCIQGNEPLALCAPGYWLVVTGSGKEPSGTSPLQRWSGRNKPFPSGTGAPHYRAGQRQTGTMTGVLLTSPVMSKPWWNK